MSGMIMLVRVCTLMLVRVCTLMLVRVCTLMLVRVRSLMPVRVCTLMPVRVCTLGLPEGAFVAVFGLASSSSAGLYSTASVFFRVLVGGAYS